MGNRDKDNVLKILSTYTHITGNFFLVTTVGEFSCHDAEYYIFHKKEDRKTSEFYINSKVSETLHDWFAFIGS